MPITRLAGTAEQFSAPVLPQAAMPDSPSVGQVVMAELAGAASGGAFGNIDKATVRIQAPKNSRSALTSVFALNQANGGNRRPGW